MSNANFAKADASISIWAALLSALVAAGGSMYLTLGMNLEACPLCFYQRTCVLGVVGILFVGLLLRDQIHGTLATIALPVATAGLGIAGIHCYLEYIEKLECPKGIEGYGTAPQQALVAQAILVFFLLIAGRGRIVALIAGLLLGGGMAYLLFISGPKPKPPPTKPYDGPLTGCRVPYPDKK